MKKAEDIYDFTRETKIVIKLLWAIIIGAGIAFSLCSYGFYLILEEYHIW